MLFKDFTFLWEPYRPVRDTNELQEAFISATEKVIEKKELSVECRFAARRLLYACIGDQQILNVLDGLLLPPPYILENLQNRQLTRKEIEEAINAIPPNLDLVITFLPFNLAVRTGIYDARLRAAIRRLSWLFSIPFDLIEAREYELINALQFNNSDDSTQNNNSNSNSEEASLLNEKKQHSVRSRKHNKKTSVRRLATVGAFTAIGGAALVVTGGVAAPFIAPALASLIGATTTTLTSIGAIGGIVLGGTAAAATLFAGIVGIATHTAALVALLTPVLTAANVTAIFGIGGASLAGYKAYRRTAESDVFMIRSTREIEELPPLELSDEGELLSMLSDSQKVQWKEVNERAAEKSKTGKEEEQDLWFGIQDVVEEATRGGIVVPSHTRAIAMINVAGNEHFLIRMRCLTFALQCSFQNYRLELKALRLTAGIWGLVPPKIIPEGNAGIFACLNRFARPTGAGCIVCYHVVPILGRTSSILRIWILTELSLLGNLTIGVTVTDASEVFQPQLVLKNLRKNIFDSDITLTTHNILIQCRFSPLPFIVISNLSNEGNELGKISSVTSTTSNITFPVKELPQRIMETMKSVNERRKIGLAIVNNSKHLIRILKYVIINGVKSSKTPKIVTPIDSQKASLGIFTNSDMSLAGAEVFYIIEIVNSDSIENQTVLYRSFYLKLQFEISALNNINIDCVATNSLQSLMEYPLNLKRYSNNKIIPIIMQESFISADICVNIKSFTIELILNNFVERVVNEKIDKFPSLTIAVGGFVSIFDQRRPQQDQQVALWSPLLPGSHLFGSTEGYVVHWEDEYQTKFGCAIGGGSSALFANKIGGKVFSTVTSVAKRQLMQGAIFAGLRAFDALRGTISLPMYALWATGTIDNAFATLSNRASYTGKDLAQALLDPQKGNRPVSLIGFGFGSRVIVECLHELNRVEAFGVVENVFLMGSTVAASRSLWRELRYVVAGRLVNIYSRTDWLLWLMYKANEAALKPMAGISPVNVPGVENFDVTFLVDSHRDYALKLKEIIEAIPERPTRQMYEKSGGSPGALVEFNSIQSASSRMITSMGSLLGSESCVTFSISNRLVSDIKGFATELYCVSVVSYGGYFDYEPPEYIPSTRCGLCGLIGDTEDGEIVIGSISYVLPLDFTHTNAKVTIPSSDLVIIILFHISSLNKEGMLTSVDARIINRPCDVVETENERRQRLQEICFKETKDPERLRIKCESVGKVRDNKSFKHTFTVDLNEIFRDGSKEAVFHITSELIEGNNFIVDVLSLLTETSTQVQRHKFTSLLFDKIYLMKEQITKTATAKPLEFMNHHMKEFSQTYASYFKNEKKDKEGKGEGKNSSSKSQIYPIILANCGDLSLFFSRIDINNDSSNNIRVGDGLEWVCLPSPELPPKNFIITAVRRCPIFSSSSYSSSSFPSNSKENERVLLDTFALDCDSGRCIVQIQNSSSNGGIDIVSYFESDSSGEGSENVSVTSIEIDGISFTMLSITWILENKSTDSESTQLSPNTNNNNNNNGDWVLID